LGELKTEKISSLAMTATQVRALSQPRTQLEILYQVAMPQPQSHLFEVTLQVKGWRPLAGKSERSPFLDLKMPVWTPGSYLIREYARHVQDFAVNGQAWQKIAKNHWQIETADLSEITMHYRVFANDLTVRTNHLDATHGYFNGAALFFYLPGFENNPIQITVVPPHSDWQVATPLPRVTGQAYTYLANDFDTLVDSPFEIGLHQRYDFEVRGKPHQLAVWGQGNVEPDRLIADTQKVIEVEADLFGGLPYDSYLFLLHLSAQSYGGLEHKNACTLNYPRLGFRTEDRYQRFMQLVAHEFFHLWNVKRIRPKGLQVFDYEGENYTPSLWFSEGTTSYYDLMIPLRAGIYDAKGFLQNLSKEITRFLTTPGRQVQSLSESSFDAWIKLYRRDANSDNNQMSYYLKGEMVSLLLDLLIRSRHSNRRSLDNVMRQMWQQFGVSETGFTPEHLEAVITSVAEVDLTNFFQRFLHSTEELPFDEYLEPFGLRLQPEETASKPPYLGLTAKSENGREMIKFVEMGSPAAAAGIDPDDELLAIDGLRVKAEQLGDRLKDYSPKAQISLTCFHQDELKNYTVTLAEPRPSIYQLVAVPAPTSQQQANLQGWIGVSTANGNEK
jgi:predicted metalloprotease with PDZ domain